MNTNLTPKSSDSANQTDYSLSIFCGILFSSWILWPFGVGILLGLLLWIAALIYLFSKKSWLKWYLFFLSSWITIPTFQVFTATRDYLNGNATFKQTLSLKQKSHNLDPTYRVWSRSSGFLLDGFELLVNIPNNLTVKTLIKVFGYQKNAYIGFYPNYSESKKLIVQYGKSTLLSKVNNQLTFILDKKQYQTPKEYLEYFPLLSENTEILACVIRGELIIIQPKTSQDIYLMDAKTTSIFACFLQSPNIY